MAAPRLTSLSHGAGCGCKLGSRALREVLGSLPPSRDPRLLVGPERSDDAGVYRVREDLAIVTTADFFTPIVDEPYDFGRIAAANALSDVYAMGAEPLTALNLVAFPLERLGASVLKEILRGGAEVVESAGAVVAGGHSIDDPEPKYGLAVTGTVDPRALLTNAGGRRGDILLLTKPLGAGAVATALKRGGADPGLVARAVDVMTTLNDRAARALGAAGATALTDVTGFGLLGHLHELAAAGRVSAVLHAAAVPAIDGVEELLRGEGAVAGGSARNRADAEAFASFAPEVPEWRRRLLTDAMTSGGLLAAVPRDRARDAPGTVVGRLTGGAPGAISVLAEGEGQSRGHCSRTANGVAIGPAGTGRA